jgi:hypothetical protein
MRPVKSFALKVAGVEVNSSGVSWNGKPLHNAIAKRIMDFGLAGLDHKPLCNFLAKLMKNPSSRAVNELYTFLEHQNLPITDNGNFLAYKGIQNDWYSCTAGDAVLLQGKVKDGKIWNAIGEVIEVERNYVDDDKDRGCSKGLHAGTMEYATGFGPRTVIVEIDPKDVVSIPSDCSCQKLRTCQYKVVDEFVAALTNPVYDSRWNEPDDFADESDESTQSDWGDPDEWGYSDEWFVTEDSNWIESVHYWHEGSRMALLKLDGDVVSAIRIKRKRVVGLAKRGVLAVLVVGNVGRPSADSERDSFLIERTVIVDDDPLFRKDVFARDARAHRHRGVRELVSMRFRNHEKLRGSKPCNAGN